MATTTAWVTPGTHNHSLSAQTLHNRLREAGLRACRSVVRQVLTRHYFVEGMSVTPRPVLLSGIDLEVEGPSCSGAVCHSIIGLSLLSLQAISTMCITGKTSSSLVVPFLQAHPNMTLQHDNATIHTARSVRDFLQDSNVSVLPWPAKSLDLANLVQSMRRRYTAVFNAAGGHTRYLVDRERTFFFCWVYML